LVEFIGLKNPSLKFVLFEVIVSWSLSDFDKEMVSLMEL
jgi:hypothetical protein